MYGYRFAYVLGSDSFTNGLFYKRQLIFLWKALNIPLMYGLPRGFQ